MVKRGYYAIFSDCNEHNITAPGFIFMVRCDRRLVMRNSTPDSKFFWRIQSAGAAFQLAPTAQLLADGIVEVGGVLMPVHGTQHVSRLSDFTKA